MIKFKKNVKCLVQQEESKDVPEIDSTKGNGVQVSIEVSSQSLVITEKSDSLMSDSHIQYEIPFSHIESSTDGLEMQISTHSEESNKKQVFLLKFEMKGDLKKVGNVLREHEIYIHNERKRKREDSASSSNSHEAPASPIREYQSFEFQARRSTRIKKRRRKSLAETNQEWGDDEQLLDWVDEGIQGEGGGFVNIGNSCYMGAVLSALAHLSYFMKDMVSEDLWKSVEGRLEESSVFKSIREILTSTKVEVSPKNLKEILEDHHQAFQGFNQEDAHEFFMCILERIQSDLISSLDPTLITSLSPVENNFSGLFVYTYTCEQCSHQTQRTESFREIGLAVPRDKLLGDRKLKRNELLTISDLFNFHFSPHNIERRCAVCDFGFSTCQILMKQVPRVLCLQFKRFYHEFANNNVVIKKTSNQIKIEDELSVASACADNVILPSGVKELRPFGLKSFLNHRGTTIRRGHYTTCAKVDKVPDCNDKISWKIINDTLTKSVEEDEVDAEIFRREHRRDIYLAFFELENDNEG